MLFSVTGHYCLKPVIDGHLKQPQYLCRVMNVLPVIWFHSRNAYIITVNTQYNGQYGDMGLLLYPKILYI